MDARRDNGVKWKSFYTVIVGAVILTVGPVYANVPIPTRAEWIEWIRMQEMHWIPTLSPEQVTQVRSALGSKYNRLVEVALTNVVLHRLEELLPLIEDGVGPAKSPAREFGGMCAEVLCFGGDPFEQFREVFTTELPGDQLLPICELLDYCRPVRYMITSLIVIEEIRAVRTGRKKKPDVHGLELSLVEKELVRLSGLKADAGVDRILDEIPDVRVITPRETTLIQVLHTYPPEKYVPSILQRLETPGSTRGYGKVLLLRSLRFRCDKLDNASRARLRSIIALIREEPPSPSLESALSALESELE
jgi:hypothetical protein